ncbi:MAG: TetR family transcriptional regulator [Marmoricola sp.]|nr:TetR family transcriptional regulator [Marmoricola sp.]
MVTEVRGPRAARGAAARDRVVGSALRAYGENGYSGSSLAGIAAAAGLTTAGLLHHFPSKEELLVAVLRERDRLDGARFHLRGFTGLEALDVLVKLVEANAETPGLVRAFTVLMGESTAENHPAGPWFRERYPRRCDNLAGALRAGIESGEIREDTDSDAVAAEIIAMMDGLQVQWLLNPERFDMARIFAHYIDTVRRALRASGAHASSS